MLPCGRIMIVDDTPANLILLTNLLDNRYQVLSVASGNECLEEIDTFKPDLLVLDVNMPEMNGYTLCKEIKSQKDKADLPVIFVSALNTLEDRLAGYDAGGDDYIAKPYNVAELNAKIDIAFKTCQHHSELQSRLDDSNYTATTAINSLSETGCILHFLENSFACTSLQSLGEELGQSLKSFGLHYCFVIHSEEESEEESEGESEGESFSFSHKGQIKPLEEELLHQLKDHGRIFNFSHRSIFNFGHISVLILNMPVADNDKYGRMKDHMQLLAGGADARVCSIIKEQRLQKHGDLKEIVLNTRFAIEQVKLNHKKQYWKAVAISKEMTEAIQEGLMVLGFDQETEMELISLIDTNIEKLLMIFSGDTDAAQFFEEVVNALNTLIDR